MQTTSLRTARVEIHSPGSGHSRWGLRFFCCIAVFAFSVSPRAYGDPVFGEVFPHRQPDGTTIKVRVWGDEFYRVVESLDGYTLTLDPTSEAACYARLSADGNGLVSTGVPVGSALRANLNLKPHIRINPASARAKIDAVRGSLAAAEAEVEARIPGRAQLAPPNNGNVKGIVLLVDFVDDEPWSIPAANVDDYCNQVGYTGYGNDGSIRDYFYDVSDGNLTYTNFVPTAYYRAQNPRDYYEDHEVDYGLRARELIVEALTDLDNQGFDFSEYDSNSDGYVDAINCFYAGTRRPFWALGLWPHASAVWFPVDDVIVYRYQITDIGDSLQLRTFCHENGHLLCYWPDLYDYGYESRGAGAYCLMAKPGVAATAATHPVEPCAYMKDEAGWSTTTLLTTPQSGLTAPSGINTIYKYAHPTNSNEYYLIENRWQSGRDVSLPDSGLAIWHIDTEGSNNNEQMTPELHYLATVVQADGQWDLEYYNNYGDTADLWEAPTSTQCAPYTYPNTDWWDGSSSDLVVSNISAAGATMTFDFSTLTDCNINTVSDDQDISEETSPDCNTNDIPDECDLAMRFSNGSDELSPIGYGSPQSYTLVSPPTALKHVTLYFEAFGDFGDPEKRIDVDLNGTPVGTIFEVGGFDCEVAPDRDGIVVPPGTFNAAAAGGSVVINMIPTSGVDPYACDSSIRVTVSYTAVSASCNQNGIPDDCDLAAGTSDDCNADDIPDECEVAGDIILLDEDFEGGLPPGWSVTGGFQITVLCGTSHPECGGSMWAYAGSTTTCAYGDYEFRELIAPPVTLGYGPSELRFCSRIDTEAGWDFGKVWVNTTPVWEDSGGTGAWQQKVVDLYDFAGQTVTITFEFTSDSNTSGWLGWQVDNVVVTSGLPDDNHDEIPDECGACCGETECAQLIPSLCEGFGEYAGDGTTCAHACGPIPAVSEWGLLIMALLLASGGTVIVRYRPRPVLDRPVGV